MDIGIKVANEGVKCCMADTSNKDKPTRAARHLPHSLNVTVPETTVRRLKCEYVQQVLENTSIPV